MDRQELILCVASYERGAPFLRELARLGCRVTLLTLEKLAHADWPREILEEVIAVPDGLTYEQLKNTVTYLARSRRFDRIVALDEFDLQNVAALREHMRIPGMGVSTTAHFRDKLSMRTEAKRSGFLVPEFTAILNYDDLRAYMAEVPAPWLLKPRAEASAVGIRKLHEPEQLWRTLDELGDRQSDYLLERFVPGTIFHVDAISSERSVVFAEVHQYGKPPMQVMHEGGVFTTRSIDRASADAVALRQLNSRLMPALNMVRGVTHAEYIRADQDGRYYFLEVAARVGGAFIADLVQQSRGVDLWVEWARIEVAHLRGETYRLPQVQNQYAGSVLCLARTSAPDTSAFNAPEIVYRMNKHHHAGLIVKSPDPERVRALLEEYSQQFLENFCAVQPPPDSLAQ
jgi:biotin carboxylase